MHTRSRRAGIMHMRSDSDVSHLYNAHGTGHREAAHARSVPDDAITSQATACAKRHGTTWKAGGKARHAPTRRRDAAFLREGFAHFADFRAEFRGLGQIRVHIRAVRTPSCRLLCSVRILFDLRRYPSAPAIRARVPSLGQLREVLLGPGDLVCRPRGYLPHRQGYLALKVKGTWVTAALKLRHTF
eukprot:3877038-Rhodomonas_salina.1